VVKVTAQGSKRVSVAALIAARPGAAGRARLIYRTHLDRGHGKRRRKGFTETDYARLLDGAHQQLQGPIVLIWDNLPTHTSRAMRQLIAARSWLTLKLPRYFIVSVFREQQRSLRKPLTHHLGTTGSGRLTLVFPAQKKLRFRW
jgi:hypothetical protein